MFNPLGFHNYQGGSGYHGNDMKQLGTQFDILLPWPDALIPQLVLWFVV